MKKISILSICLLAFIAVYCLGKKDSELDIAVVVQNGDLYEAISKEVPGAGFMKDVPSKGWTALVINCNEKKFDKCFQILNKFQIKGKLEVQVFSPTRSYIKTKDESILSP